MATSIGNLVAIVSLNSQKFERGIKRVKRQAKAFGDSVGRMARRVTAFGTVATAAAAAGLGVLVKRELSAIDATAKLADTLGLTTEQMVGYQHAAKLSGLENKDIETSFKRLQKNVSDARLGLTTAKRAFDALGVSADDLVGKSPDQQMKIVADAFANIEYQADRTRVAQDLFGRSGLKLVKVLEQGSGGISKMQAEAKRLGLTFSRLDAAKVEEANDSMARAVSLITATGRAIAISLAPVLDKFSDSVVDASGDVSGLEKTTRNTFKLIAIYIGEVIDKFKSLELRLIDARIGAGQFVLAMNRITGIADPLDLYTSKIRNLAETELARLEKRANTIELAIGKTGEKLGAEFDKLHADFERAAAEARAFEMGLKAIANIKHPFFGNASGAAGAGGVGKGLNAVFNSFVENMAKAGDAFMDRVRDAKDRAEDIRDIFSSREDNGIVERGSVEAFQATRQNEKHAAETARHTAQLVDIGRRMLQNPTGTAGELVVVNF